MSARVTGKVVGFTESGDLITDISGEQLRNAPKGDVVRVRCGPHETFGLFDAEHEEPYATFMAVLARDGFLHLRVVGMSARELLGIALDAAVTVEW